MKILLTGATGFIGSALAPFLKDHGHDVYKLVRNRNSGNPSDIYWDPAAGVLAPESLEGFDAVINMSGENLADGRWTESKKQRILSSRVKSTQLLSDCMNNLRKPPNVFVSFSAIGYYGSRGDSLLTELSSDDTTFLSRVCRLWEDAASGAEKHGIRVVRLRLGVVLSSKGGALAKMLPPFKMWLGGPLGTGEQYMSWIALDDLLAAILHVIQTKTLSGAVNAVAPNPVTNAEFTKTLGAVLKVPTLFRVPAFMLRLLLGEMAEEMLLGSARVRPERLLESGFKFQYPELKGALEHLI